MDKDSGNLYDRYQLLSESVDILTTLKDSKFKDNGIFTVKIKGIDRKFTNVSVEDDVVKGNSIQDYLDLGITPATETVILNTSNPSAPGTLLGDFKNPGEENWKGSSSAIISPTSTGKPDSNNKEEKPGFIRKAASAALDAAVGGDMGYSPLRYARDTALGAAKDKILTPTKKSTVDINDPNYWSI